MQSHKLNEQAGMLRAIFSDRHNHDMLYSKPFAEGFTISFRTLQLASDTGFLHEWVNDPGAKTFWQMDGPVELLETTYAEILVSEFTHSFIGFLNNMPVCQVDVYHVLQDELNNHVTASENDYGIHFMMAPVQKKIPNLSVCCMQTCLSFLFSCKDVDRIFGEPDSRNIKANELVTKAGFKLLRPIQLSCKTANLYCCTKENFAKQKLYGLSHSSF